MAEEHAGFLGRWFGRKRSTGAAHHEAIPVSQPTVGLCFNYERGLAYDSAYLSDTGLEHVLKILQRHGLRGTFNCPAKLCETAADRLEMIVDAGHELGVLGYADESPRELTDGAMKQLVYACRNGFQSCGFKPVGFRSPRSHWDDRLCVELRRHGFRYNAEHDHSPHLYVLDPGDPPLIRVPIRTDDKDLRRREEKAQTARSKHHRVVRKAVEACRFVSVCFHPWILAENLERMRHWEEWIETAVGSGALMVALEDALPNARRSDEVDNDR